MFSYPHLAAILGPVLTAEKRLTMGMLTYKLPFIVIVIVAP